MRSRLRQREIPQHARVTALPDACRSRRPGVDPRRHGARPHPVADQPRDRDGDGLPAASAAATDDGGAAAADSAYQDDGRRRNADDVAVDLPDLREDVRAEFQLQEPHPNAL